jgi:hypothetical protein
VEFVGILGAADPLANIIVTQEPRNLCESLQMLGSRIGRRKKQKDEIDGLIIDRLEGNWPIEAREDGVKPIKPA